MMTLTTNIAPAKPAAEKTYRTRNDAIAAATLEIGPHARNGFEFDCAKVDGRWRWTPTEEVRPPTGAEFKAMGGKKAFLAATAMATDEGIPSFLKRGDPACIMATPRPAPGKLAGAISEPDAPQQPDAPKNAPVRPARAPAATYAKLKATGGLRSDPVPPPVALSDEALDSLDRLGSSCAIEAAGKERKKRAPSGTSKTAMVGEMLLRKEGCTSKEILDLTGWPSVSVPAVARACGLTLVKTKVDGVTRYTSR